MIYVALHKDIIKDYFTKINSATTEQIKYAQEFYGNKTANSILSIDGDIATIKIRGILNNEVSYISLLFGYQYTRYLSILEALEEVENNKDINNVVLDIDSPGGYAESGLDHVWQKLIEIKNNKNIIAVNNGMVASASYWIASAANKIYSTSVINQQGSIGVYAIYYDYTEQDKKYGVKEIKIRSSNAPNKAKRPGEKGFEDTIQKDLDYVEALFISSVAQGRNISEVKIKKNFGRGALLLTSEARQVNMIDDVRLQKDIFSLGGNGSVEAKSNKERTDRMLTLDSMLAEHPELNAQFEARIEARANTLAENRVKEAEKVAFDRGVVEGEKTGAEKVHNTNKGALAFLTNKEYSKEVRAIAVEAIEGKVGIAELRAVVAYEDKLNAAKKLLDANNDPDNQQDTPPLNPKVTKSSYEQTGVIETEEDYKKATGKAGK